MKKLLLIIFVLAIQFVNAQNPSYKVAHDTCLDKKFSIVFYVLLDSNFVPLISKNGTDSLIDTLNSRFKNICVTFVSCSTVHIPNYAWGKWRKHPTGTHVIPNYYTDKTLNIYVVDTVKGDLSNTEGGAYTFSPTTQNLADPYKDVIVIDYWKVLQDRSHNVFHLFGDYFGLPHTGAEINPGNPATPGPKPGITSHEFADGTNCATHGDGFCDTDADPVSLGPVKDSKGQYYTPPLDNYMSMYNTRCRFTQEQYNRLAYLMATKRLYLH